MSLALFMITMKKNRVLFLIFLGVLSMYTTIMIYMYDPNQMDAVLSMIELFPEDLMEAMGFSSAITDLASYLASWLYGLLMIGFPMVYCVILGNRLVAQMVDNGSFACLLSTPNSRVKIIVTQGIYAAASLGVLFLSLFGITIVICGARLPGALDVSAFFLVNMTTFMVCLVVMMINFFFSCMFNESRKAMGLGAGIPVLFLLLNMLGGTSPDLAVIKKFSIFGLYDPVELVRNTSAGGVNLFYIFITLLLFAGGVLIFRRKQLPL